MTIQLNTDKNITGSEKLKDKVSQLVEASLDRFSQQLTRVEVHLSDVNGEKAGINDKRCVLEARIEGKKPVVVTSNGDSIEHAMSLGLDKLEAALSKITDKMKGK